MKFKKKFVSLLLGCALVFTGVFMSCDNQNQNQNQNTPAVEIEAELKNDESGIELSWGKVPEQVKKVRIYTRESDGDESENCLFIINDLSKVESVKDEFVTAGKEYQYMIKAYGEKDVLIDKSEWKTITANGGKGELDFKIEAVSTGIHITAARYSKDSTLYIYKLEDVTEQEEEIEYFKESSTVDFIDTFVEPGKEYAYGIEEQIGSNGYWKNGEIVEVDALVSYPRHKSWIQSVTATGGSRDLFKTLPSFGYYEADARVWLEKEPSLKTTAQEWEIDFYYTHESQGKWLLFSIDQETEAGQKCGIRREAPEGEWTFSSYSVDLYFEDYGYSFESKDIEIMKSVPKTISYSKDNLLSLTATPGTDGIKLEWKNLPKDAKTVKISSNKGYKRSEHFTIKDLTNITSVTDKYVTNNKEYKYRISAYDSRGFFLMESDWVTVTATGGQGERQLSLTATSDGIHVTGTRLSTTSNVRIQKSCDDIFDEITLNDNNQNIDFTDPFVKAGTEYSYSICEKIESADHTLIEVIDGARIYVTATGGSGNLDITNKPSVTFDAEQETVTFSAKPQFLASPAYWKLLFYYENEEGDSENLFSFNSEETNLTRKIEEIGNWTFDYCYITVQTDAFGYLRWNEDVSVFASFPQEITISEEGKPRLTATPTNKGLLFEWFDLPEDTEYVVIDILNCDTEILGQIRPEDLTKGSLEFNYVEPDNEYYTAMEIHTHTETDWFITREFCVTPESGLGDPKITNKPVVTWNNKNNYVTFSELPQVPLPSDITWNIDYIYSLPSETGGHYEDTLFRHYSKDSNKEKALFINDFYGSWTSYAYKIEVRTDSFYYFGYGEDISKIGEIPEEVIISEENAFHLEATQIAQGIKLEWKNIPKNTKTIKISKNWRKGESYSQSFITISDLDDETYYIDENDRITPGQKYEYYPYAYPDFFEIMGGGAVITATGGSGE